MTAEEIRTFAPYLDYALNPLHPEIADASALSVAHRRLGGMRLGKWVPPPLGIEIPLGTPDPGFDLSVGYATGFGNREFIDQCPLAQAATAPRLPDVLSEFDNIWLEHDLIHPQSNRASIYFSPRLLEGAIANAADRLAPHQIASICTAAMVLNPQLSKSSRKRLTEMQSAYSDPKAYVLCGVMTGRKDVRVRLVLRFETIQAAASYFRAFGFESQSKGLVWLDSTFGSVVERVLVGCEIGTENTLGIELYAPDGNLRQGNADDLLLETLEQQGLCHPEKRKAIRSFPGRTAISTGQENWAYLEKRDGPRQGAIQVPICDRQFHHVKVTLLDGEPVQAKAYASALFRWWFH
ncbi:hypothetical protein [Ruegeria sp. A3M17]|uniref:hypothetical protein n=1 Tax=Ruegeria sp. A3M17 TaxID=2267229 RepID=UPI000DE83701|nr:hypothetical protein [Ruegeria sp. A3M17]RBW52491.1 hypothetical protein DS906_20760 [Ruegeria sp. A3M17]